MGFHPHSADIDQPLALQPLIGHPGLCRRRLRQVPVALAAERRQDRVAFTRSQGQQVTYLGSRSGVKGTEGILFIPSVPFTLA